jgi:hypothetical protein
VQSAQQQPKPQDVVVVIPGIMGSRLRTADDREVWGPGAGSVLRALRTLGGSLRDLQLPDDVGDGPAPDGVRAHGLMPSLHAIPGIWTPVKGYSELEGFLRQKRFGLIEDRPDDPGASPGNLVLFAYDWRLSNRRTAQLLRDRVEPVLERWRASAPVRATARLVFVCHSMGGLVARWYVQKLGGGEVTRAIVTLGTPHRGACKALEQLVNGVRKGPLKTDLTDFARSLPSLHQLLPEYACVANSTAPLAKTTEITLPHLDPARVADGMRFHDDLDVAPWPAGCQLVPIVGIGQPTWTTAELDGERVVPLDTIADEDLRGDGTVPRLAARPKTMSEHDTSLRGVADGHGVLSGHRSVRDQLDLILTAQDIIYRGTANPAEADADAPTTGIATPDLHEAGEPVRVTVRSPHPRLLEVVAIDEQGAEVTSELARGTAPTITTLTLGPGVYIIAARAPDDPRGHDVPIVHTTTLVMP